MGIPNVAWTMTELNAATRAYIEKKVVNNVTKADPLFYKL